MKRLFTLLIVTVCLTLSSATVFGQGTKDAPQPGSKFTYGLSSAESGATFTWWVASDVSGLPKLDYLTDYTITGYPTIHPTSVLNKNDVEITWGNNLATVGSPLYVFVEADLDGCKSIRYYTVTPTNSIDLAFVDVTGIILGTPETSDGSDNNSGTHCPDFDVTYSSDDATYNSGKTEVQVRIDRSSSLAAWSFDFTVTGPSVVTSGFVYTTDGASASATGTTVSASANANYVLVTFNVDNVPGTALSITCTVTDGKDVNGAADATSPAPVVHILKVMPVIGSFNL